MTTNTEKRRKFVVLLGHPHIQIIVGAIGLTTVILDEVFLSMEHGVIALSLWHILQGSSTIIESLERIFKTDKIFEAFRRFRK